AKVTHAVFVPRGIGLLRVMGRTSDNDVVADDPAGYRGGDVLLAQMQNGCSGRSSYICPVIDGEQGSVPLSGRGEHLERGEFIAGFKPLFAQLDDVDAAG